ncbi:MAG: hypothetical protein OXB84_02660, partial [Halobacteriovoraceae bacterium]|nr:hypothetical protein [Halobacteriovoraceae bacterium]
MDVNLPNNLVSTNSMTEMQNPNNDLNEDLPEASIAFIDMLKKISGDKSKRDKELSFPMSNKDFIRPMEIHGKMLPMEIVGKTRSGEIIVKTLPRQVDGKTLPG